MTYSPEISKKLRPHIHHLVTMTAWGQELQAEQEKQQLPPVPLDPKVREKFNDPYTFSLHLLEARRIYELKFAQFIEMLILEYGYTQLAKKGSVLTLNRFNDEVFLRDSKTEESLTLWEILEFIDHQAPENDEKLIEDIKSSRLQISKLNQRLQTNLRRYERKKARIIQEAEEEGSEPQIPLPNEPIVNTPITEWCLSRPKNVNGVITYKIMYRVYPPDSPEGEWHPGWYSVEEIEQWVDKRFDREDKESPVSLINKKQPVDLSRSLKKAG